MELTEIESASGKFTLRGICPHCGDRSVFIQITSVHQEVLAIYQHVLAVGMQCQGCLKYILGIVYKNSGHNRATTLEYLDHYPLGAPDDAVHETVPPQIAADFGEAKRCLWVKSYKAAVAMCRRAVEAACKREGATGSDLEKKIDSLAQ